MRPLSRRLPRWLRAVNLAAAVTGIGLTIVFIVVSYVVDSKPFDYALLMRGADLYCFNNPGFAYGADLFVYYPAPFYAAFCLPNRYAEPLLRSLWMGAPVLASLWLARGRAAVLVYPPLFVLVLLGQSSWLLLPVFILAARAAHDRSDRPAPWWHGLALAPCVFKPHIAFPAAVYLLYRWWQRRDPALPAAIVAVAAVILPAFILRPSWLAEWLPHGRGFEPISLASIAFVPVQLAELGFAPGPGGQLLVYGFCALVGLGLYALLRWRRGRLALYDWMLLFFFINPFANDYDLIVLLPFITQTRRRLLVALVGGALGWVFAMMTLRWSMSFMALLALLALRLGGEARAARPESESIAGAARQQRLLAVGDALNVEQLPDKELR